MQLGVHFTQKHATQINCLNVVKKWLSANKLKIIQIRQNLFCLVQELSLQNLANFSKLIYSVTSSYMLRKLGTLVSGLILIFPSLAMSGISDLKRLKGCLTHEAALFAANALVGSRIDYFNSFFRSLPALDLYRLQCV